MNGNKTKEKGTLTLKLERETLAELKAAAKIIGATSYASLVHQLIILKIREAKQMVSKSEFDRLRDEQMENIKIRSQAKSESHKKWIANIPHGEETEKISRTKQPSKEKSNEKSTAASNIIKTKSGEILWFVEEADFTDNEEK